MEVPMTRHTESLAPALGLAIVSRAVRTILNWMGEVFNALEDRGQVRNLAELDDRALKDIGLMRGDVDGALAEPFYRKPTLVLVRSQAHRIRVQRLSVVDARGVRPIVPFVKAPQRV
jgi:uncharacterized protein YjiS (DUF1127 family)